MLRRAIVISLVPESSLVASKNGHASQPSEDICFLLFFLEVCSQWTLQVPRQWKEHNIRYLMVFHRVRDYNLVNSATMIGTVVPVILVYKAVMGCQKLGVHLGYKG